MSIVRELALLHLGITAVLLVVFVAVLLWQRLTGAAATAVTPLAYPSDAEGEAGATPATVPSESDELGTGLAPSPPVSGTSVVQWHVDLRDLPSDAPRELQRSS